MDKMLSVIIVTYKKPELVKQCLDSIYKFNDIGDKLEIIVSDNSPDDSIERILEHRYTDVIFLRNGNIGFGSGNNAGVRISRSPYLLFLNPDTILIEPVFGFALERFQNGSSMFGVQLLDSKRRKNTSFAYIDCFSIYKSFLGKLSNKVGVFLSGKMAILGADIFVTKDVFIESGMFDENIFMYSEENDLTKRVQKAFPNCKVMFFKEKSIIHLEGGTTKGQINDTVAFVDARMKTYKYYCNKWNIKLVNVIRFFQHRYMLLALVSILKGNIEQYHAYSAISIGYKKELKKSNE